MRAWIFTAWILSRFGPGETKLVATGLAIELPAGYEAQIRSPQRPGLEVFDYSPPTAPRPLIPVIAARSRNPSCTIWAASLFRFSQASASAQMVIARYCESVEWEEGDLADSRRGEGGFGSSGR